MSRRSQRSRSVTALRRLLNQPLRPSPSGWRMPPQPTRSAVAMLRPPAPRRSLPHLPCAKSSPPQTPSPPHRLQPSPSDRRRQPEKSREPGGARMVATIWRRVIPRVATNGPAAVAHAVLAPTRLPPIAPREGHPSAGPGSCVPASTFSALSSPPAFEVHNGGCKARARGEGWIVRALWAENFSKECQDG
jgi:hypothetical protein